MSIAAQLERRIRSQGAQAMATGVETIVASLALGEPYKKGGLKRSKQVSGIRPTGTGFSATITYTAPQATFTEEGTSPHVIVPRRAKVLAFQVGGRTVFARRVNHPGTKAQHWFSKRVNESRWLAALRRAFV